MTNSHSVSGVIIQTSFSGGEYSNFKPKYK